MRQKLNHTKIIATVGPSSDNKAVIKELMLAGVNVFRLNFSHGTHKEHENSIKLIREVSNETGLNIAIMADLQGPKIRVGKIKDNVILKEGRTVQISTKSMLGGVTKFSITYKDLPRDVKKGDRILLDDGKLELIVSESNNKDLVKAKVVYGGILLSNKGANLPNTNISQPSMTRKDFKDLSFILKQRVNWIALSFVRSSTDIYDLKKIIKRHKHEAKVIAKIEKPEALQNIHKIINESDAVMIARGDLGVEVPMEDIPTIQKDLVSKSIRNNKPVIIATQLMENMINNPRPLRAEITDVANSVIDGADAVMLSGETSVGKYPVEVINMIKRIINAVEKEKGLYLPSDGVNKWNNYPKKSSPSFLSDAICFNACKIADNVNAKAIISMTESGYTAFQISSYRPKSYVYIFTANKYLLNMLSMVWGVKAFYYNRFVSTDETIMDVKHILKKHGYVKTGDVIINTASMPINDRQKTNTLKVSKII